MMSRWLAVCVLCALCFAAVDAKHAKKTHKAPAAVDWSKPAVNHEIIYQVNSDPSSTWEAGINSKFKGMKLSDVKSLLGAKLDGKHKLPKKAVEEENENGEQWVPPTDFDARTQWGKQCPSLYEVRDQSDCGSCWAFGAAEAMTDRVCIAFKGQKKPHLSAADLLACCSECGDGCDGGYPDSAWEYWVDTGLVTGGNYTNSTKANGCYPYPFPPCEHHVNGTHYPPCPSEEYDTPQCPNECDAVSGLDWDTDKVKGVSAYSIDSTNMTAIKFDLFTYGPMEVAFEVYEDFLTYKSGVYQHKTGSYLGGHAVKIIGWGVENNVKYWTIMNSWNSDWGDNGQFKILAEKDECGIEDDVCAGLAQ